MPRKDRRKIICRANNTIDETATEGDHFSWKTQGSAEHMGTVGICAPLPQCDEIEVKVALLKFGFSEKST